MEVVDHSRRLNGVYAPISTPFSEDESVDWSGLRHNLSRYAESGLNGYVALGSNGENKSLTEEEKLDVLATIVANKASSQIVIAGATYEAQRDTERFFRIAAAYGADYGLLLPPSYFKAQMTDEVLYRYYASVADTSPLPVLIYNAPKFCAVTISPELVARLSPHENIVGLKDSASSGFERFIEAAESGFCVTAGSISFLFPAMMAGATGGTVSLGNSFPSLAVELFQCGLTRDASRGTALQERARRINRGISGAHGVPGVKAAMDLAGLCGGYPRRPLLPLTQDERAQLKTFLTEEGLL